MIKAAAILACAAAVGILAGCSATPDQPSLAPPPAPLLVQPEPPSLARDPVPAVSPGNWFTVNDYPSRAMREYRQGLTEVRLTIGPEGRVTGCTIAVSSGHEVLDTATCSIITRRARFNPALDAEGNPTSSAYTSRVRWSIADTEPVPLPLAGSVTTTMMINRNGWAEECRTAQSSGDLAARNPVRSHRCEFFYTLAPVTDRRGRPYSRIFSTRRDVRIRTVGQDYAPEAEGQATWRQRPHNALPPTGRIVRAYIVEADGRQSHCRILSVSGEMANDTSPGSCQCQVDRFTHIFVDASGRPERREVTETERVSLDRRR